MSHLKLLIYSVPTILTMSLVSAQVPSWSTPASGVFYDQASLSLRPIVGYVGSSYAGNALASSIAWARIAPDGHAALFMRDGVLWWHPDLSAAPEIPAQPLSGLAAPSECLWSSDSTRAVLLVPGSLGLAWVTIRGQQAVVQRQHDLPSLESAEWLLLAADSAAGRILLSSRNAGGNLLWSASLDAAPEQLDVEIQATAAVFKDTATALIADAETHQISMLSLDSGTIEPLLTAADGIDQPVGLALTPDRSHLAVSERALSSVRIYSLASNSVELDLGLGQTPGPMVAFGRNRFLLTQRQRPDEPLLLLDMTGSPRILFVPVGEPAQ